MGVVGGKGGRGRFERRGGELMERCGLQAGGRTLMVFVSLLQSMRFVFRGFCFVH